MISLVMLSFQFSSWAKEAQTRGTGVLKQVDSSIRTALTLNDQKQLQQALTLLKNMEAATSGKCVKILYFIAKQYLVMSRDERLEAQKTQFLIKAFEYAQKSYEICHSHGDMYPENHKWGHYSQSLIQRIPKTFHDFVMPLEGFISSLYGVRTHPILGGYRFHHGLDIAANRGTPVASMCHGKIDYRGWKSGYGYTVIIHCTNGYSTLFAHLNDTKNHKGSTVNYGELVKPGSIVGHVGSTGTASGAHLHLELHKPGKPSQDINPAFLVKKLCPGNTIKIDEVLHCKTAVTIP
jgi:murein DD-endopeptidase MepM/ murein hydrolase activator NlpD